MALDEKSFIKDPKLMKRSLFVLVLTLLGFILHGFLPTVEAPAVAISGATLLMLIGVKKNEVDETFSYVEWETLFFFAGLFTLIGGLQDIGVIKYLAKAALDLTGGNIPFASMLVLWVSGIASATIDNIPYVATLIPLLKNMVEGMGLSPTSPNVEALWWSLSLGACLGGNGTLIGASANVIVAGLAEREGHGFSYWEFLKIGAPLTFIALVLSSLYIYLRYLL
jgi:Na+/H+ antiporter NhaD/arsenite permease-like protein